MAAPHAITPYADLDELLAELLVVAARLGHADPAITLRVYAHVLREQAAGVADVFAQAVATSS